MLLGFSALTGCSASSSRPGSSQTVPGLTLGPAVASPAESGVATGSAPTNTITPGPPASVTATTFAMIADYGAHNDRELEVSSLVASWRPEFIVTSGDNYMADAGGTGSSRYDRSAGAYYGSWMAGAGTADSHLPINRIAVNAFFPSLGNHDYVDATLDTYLHYFKLPGDGLSSSSGNERYYDFVRGPVHFFVLNSNPQEPDGTSSTSTQARWLQTQLAASASPWNIVVDHHPPYSSTTLHGSTPYMQWPFGAWGADAVVSGHVHAYERIVRDGTVYFVNGMGGDSGSHSFGAPIAGSVVRHTNDWGALKIVASDTDLDFEFWDVGGLMVDRYHLGAGQPPGN